MHRVAVGGLVALALGACLRENVKYCDNGAYCPEPLACTNRSEPPFCGPAEAVNACLSQTEEVPCTTTDISQGFCDTGLCTRCDVNNAACSYPGWTAMESGVSADLLALWVASPREVYILGKTGTLTRWNGRTWTVLPSAGTDTKSLAGASSTDLWATATTIAYHFDGTSWAAEPAAMNSIQGVWGAGPSDFFSAGFKATVGRYQGTWVYGENTANLMNLTFNAVWGTSNSDVFVVGNGGSAVHFNGTMWSQQVTPGNHVLLAVAGSGPNDVYASGRTTVGSAPAMLHYVGSWSDVTGNLPTDVQAPVNLRGVWANATNVFAVGDAGKIIHSTDQGATWATMQSNTTNVLNAISGSGADVFVVGNGGAVLRYRVP